MRNGILAVLFVSVACGKGPILPPSSPFPPKSRWEKVQDLPLASALATDGTRVFSAVSAGSVMAMDAATGEALWTRAGVKPGLVVARPNLLVFVEKGGVVWGLNPQEGNAQWKTTTQVADVQSVRLDGNRVFVGGASGLAALVVSTGELRYDVSAKDVRDLDAAGDWLASREEGALTVRERESGKVRFQLASPEGEFGAPAIFPDGRVVLGSGNRLVRAVSPDGEFRWRFKVGARVKDRPLDFLDGKRVGVISFEGVFYELSLNGGDMRRRVRLSSRPFGQPQWSAGRVWVPIFEDEIAAIDPKTMALVGRARFGGSFLSSPIPAAGRFLAEVSGPRRIVALETVPPSS